MIERLLNPIKSRIRLMISRAVISACKDGKVDIGLLAGESREDVDFLQQYGFSSRPVGKVSGVALFIGGSRDNGVVVASRGDDSDMSVDLEEGEVAVHSPFGSKIILKKDGSIWAVPGEGKQLCVEGDVWATGDFAANCTKVGDNTMVDMTAIHLTRHTHASAVGPTAPTTGP